jgi:hypothetical protein
MTRGNKYGIFCKSSKKEVLMVEEVLAACRRAGCGGRRRCGVSGFWDNFQIQ